MGRVLIADNADFRAVAIEAGSAAPKEIVYYAETGELEVLDVTNNALVAARDAVANGTAVASDKDKAVKIAELSAAAHAAIEGGFQSDPKGTGAVWFDSKLEDQVNLIGNVLAGGPTTHSSRGTKGGAKAYDGYTNAELVTVLEDGRDVKLAYLQLFAVKKAAAEAATTLAELAAVVW